MHTPTVSASPVAAVCSVCKLWNASAKHKKKKKCRGKDLSAVHHVEGEFTGDDGDSTLCGSVQGVGGSLKLDILINPPPEPKLKKGGFRGGGGGLRGFSLRGGIARRKGTPGSGCLRNCCRHEGFLAAECGLCEAVKQGFEALKSRAIAGPRHMQQVWEPPGDSHKSAVGTPRPPRRNSGLCHVCTGGKQYKAQKENGLVSGL